MASQNQIALNDFILCLPEAFLPDAVYSFLFITFLLLLLSFNLPNVGTSIINK